jgi:hypothetical protein
VVGGHEVAQRDFLRGAGLVREEDQDFGEELGPDPGKGVALVAVDFGDVQPGEGAGGGFGEDFFEDADEKGLSDAAFAVEDRVSASGTDRLCDGTDLGEATREEFELVDGAEGLKACAI